MITREFTIIFYDSYRNIEITRMQGCLSEAPLVNDCVILLSSEDYEEVYGYDNRTATIKSRLVDYRDDTITLFVDK